MSDLNIAPIIVCGMPRSGTSMARDLLRSMDNIYVINGEPSIKLLRSYYSFLNEVDSSLKDIRKPSRKSFDLNKDFLTFMALCAIDKYPKKIPADFSIFNYFVAKSPSFEFHIKELSEAFSKENPPKFIYCTRSPEKVWKSLISMPWNNRNVLSFKARYIKSHNCFYNFLKKNGEGTVFDLDSYINDSDKFSYFKHVLDKVGVSIPLASRDKVIQTQNGNSSKAKGYEALSDSAIFDNDFSSIKNDITIFNARDRLLGIS